MAATRRVPGFNPIVPITLGTKRISDPPVAAVAQVVEQTALQEKEKVRPKGRASTLMTGPGGLLGAPGITRRTLIGF